MTLYELRNEIMELLAIAEEENLDPDVVSDTMEGLEFELSEKADSYAKIMKILEGDVDTIDKEIKRLTEKKTTIKNNISLLKGRLEKTMIDTGNRNLKTVLFSFNIQKNPPSVTIIDEEEVPKEFWIAQQPKLDKKGILSYIKEHDVTWAKLNQTEGLRIR